MRDPAMEEVRLTVKELRDAASLLLANFDDDAVGSATGNYFKVSTNRIFCRFGEFKAAANAALKEARQKETTRA